MALLDSRVISVVAGRVEPSGSWVYVWLDRDQGSVAYVGATGFDPELRAHLHLTSIDPELGRVRAAVPRFDERRFDILAFSLPASVSRHAVKQSLLQRMLDPDLSEDGPGAEVVGAIMDALTRHRGDGAGGARPSTGVHVRQESAEGSSNHIAVRAGTIEDAKDLALLKDEWSPRATPSRPAKIEDLARDLAAWMTTQGDSVMVRVAEHGGRLVAMAWLVVFPRVPDLDDCARLTGDVQSVFVLPEYRRRGVGRALVQSLLAAADERAIPRITVSANLSSEPLYRALGFEPSPLLLERRGRASR